MDVACPQCGNPNLDVDAANSVVYCKKCGFAVHVDPQTGDVQPLAPGGSTQEAPAAYAERTILGMDPVTFLLGGTAAFLLLTVMNYLQFSWFVVAESLLVIVWWYRR
ncbi:MAG: hypothetical protein V1787_04650 [Candidatus Micrarchaeota archaeon]